MLAKRLKTSEPMNQEANIVISKDSNVATGGGTVAKAVVFNFSVIEKIEDTLKNLTITVMGLLAKIDNASLFNGVCIFTSGLGVGFFGAEIAIIMNSSLAWHVSKVDKIPGWLISVHLLFKDKFSVIILGLYARASVNICFSQAFSINSLISKAANFSSFTVVGGNFNENESKKSASFKFCSDLNLVNTFNGHSLAKTPTWSNSRGVEKILDFIFVSKNLTFIITLHKIDDMSGFFDMDYKAISVVVGLGGLLDACLNSVHKQAN
ncbi:hypothetical protein G9A89_008535 [Geosiphon pyriformis]|nr:hypothetical protein G9A89_008535 [Geosiphon pyriformis]